MTTPMMRQYEEAKQACGDALLLFRMGDFYELFHEDAKVAARVLGLTLTSRDKESANPTAMAGFPHHQLDAYLRKLIAAGFRAAVCEQVEDPRQAKGLVRREITRIVSAGTLTDDQLLDPRETNWLAAISFGRPTKQQPEPVVGVAWAELSSGRFEAGVFPLERLEDELTRIAPAEVLLREDDPRATLDNSSPWPINYRPAWTFALDEAQRTLASRFGVKSLDGFGFVEGDEPALQAAGAVVNYLSETQSGQLDHFDSLIAYHRSSVMQIDAATRHSLELVRTIRSGERSGTLLAVLDNTVTPMGARLTAAWLSAPLMDLQQIADRQDAVEELRDCGQLRQKLRQQLDQIYDVPRLLGRVATHRTSPRDLQQVGATLERLPTIRASIASCQSALLTRTAQAIQPCESLREMLCSALVDDPPLSPAEGGFIRSGFCERLDGLRQLATGGKEWIARYQAEQVKATGIANIKVGFNKVFGYYLEVSNAHRDRVPETFIRKQTLKNAERFITPELKEYEEKVLSADDQARAREDEIFAELRAAVHGELRRLKQSADALALTDSLCGLAELAARRGYVRPRLTSEAIVDIEEGRHPVLDATMPPGEFVPNDSRVSPENGMIQIITGPNMAGKSTYIRQVALLNIMAQIGSFLPAKKATIGIADRVFARVGASDELSRGHSTFMVEMVETARILNTATPQSLVVLDEIGRGTSTYDGLSLAWAITEHLHENVGCRTLFATHYHELTQLTDSLPRVANLNVAVREWDEEVVFLHRIIPGAADKSYGIHVARLAGIPAAVNERAKDILAQLEESTRDPYDRPLITPPSNVRKPSALQMTLFGIADHPLLDDIRGVDLERLTPLEALAMIQRWQERLAQEPTISAR